MITYKNISAKPHSIKCIDFMRWGARRSVFMATHDDVINSRHFPRYWPFVREIHRWPVSCPHKGHRRGALMFSLICSWINASVNNREAGDLRRHRAHYDITAVFKSWHVYNSMHTDHDLLCFIMVYHLSILPIFFRIVWLLWHLLNYAIVQMPVTQPCRILSNLLT